MGYASKAGRARTDVNNPKAFAVCDRCGIWYNHSDLNWQFDYRGRTLQNIRILVCEICMDEPQPQLKPRIIPPDPLPVLNARTEPFCQDETNNRFTSGQNSIDFWTGIPIAGGDNRITMNYNNRVTQHTGTAPGSKSIFPGVSYMVPEDDTGLPCGFTGIPNTGIIVEELQHVYWLSDTTGPAYFSNADGFPMYWEQYPSRYVNSQYVVWMNQGGFPGQWVNNTGASVNWVGNRYLDYWYNTGYYLSPWINFTGYPSGWFPDTTPITPFGP